MEGEGLVQNVGVSLGVKKGAWSVDEDLLLTRYISKHGERNWYLIPERTGLNRCRKSCRLRWLNYLSPDIKRGRFDDDEMDLIFRLHKLLGNRWSLIAGRIPGRTANDVKNFWNIHLKSIKKLTGSSKKIDILPKFDIPVKVEVIRPRARTLSTTSFPLKNKSVMIEATLDKTKKNRRRKYDKRNTT